MVASKVPPHAASCTLCHPGQRLESGERELKRPDQVPGRRGRSPWVLASRVAPESGRSGAVPEPRGRTDRERGWVWPPKPKKWT